MVLTELDQHPAVVDFVTQPVRLSTYAFGKAFQRTPDVLCRLIDGRSVLVEIKDDTTWDPNNPDTELAESFAKLHVVARSLGIDFVVATPGSAQRRANLDALHRCRDVRRIYPRELDSVIAFAKEQRFGFTVAEAIAAGSSAVQTLPAIMHLCWRGWLSIELEATWRAWTRMTPTAEVFGSSGYVDLAPAAESDRSRLDIAGIR